MLVEQGDGVAAGQQVAKAAAGQAIGGETLRFDGQQGRKVVQVAQRSMAIRGVVRSGGEDCYYRAVAAAIASENIMPTSPARLLERIRRLIATPSVSSVSPQFDQSNRPVIDLLADWLESRRVRRADRTAAGASGQGQPDRHPGQGAGRTGAGRAYRYRAVRRRSLAV